MLNYSNYDNPESLAKELVQHFAESMAPIEVEFNSMSEMEPFSLAIDKIEGASNLGGKFLCKKAGQGMGSSYRASEIMKFNEEAFPVAITFAKKSQLGAFAYTFVDAFKKKEDDALWEKMVSDGLIKREELEEKKASILGMKELYPHTKIVDAKSFSEFLTACKKGEDSDNQDRAADLVICRFMRGFDADTLVKAKQILDMQYSGVISEAEADIELDKLEAALYPNISNDPLEQLADKFSTEVVNADALAEAGVISQHEADRRKDVAYDEMVAKAQEVGKEKYKTTRWIIAFAIAIVVILIKELLF